MAFKAVTACSIAKNISVKMSAKRTPAPIINPGILSGWSASPWLMSHSIQIAATTVAA
jgi:hypothetical protein